jgi:hypothetical protein
MIRSLLSLGVCLAMSACVAAPPKESAMASSPAAPQTLTLLPQASAPLDASASLRFERVEDSRCPPDVRCITAGKLLFHFTLSAAATREAFTLDAEQPSHASSALPGLRIALAPMTMPPARPSTASGPAPAFPVTLTIARQP